MPDFETHDEYAAADAALDRFVIGRPEQGLANLELATAALRFGWLASRAWHRARDGQEIQAAADRLRATIERER